jgi:hypothetical protein
MVLQTPESKVAARHLPTVQNERLSFRLKAVHRRAGRVRGDQDGPGTRSPVLDTGALFALT